VTADFVRLETPNVPKAKPHVDDEGDKLEDVDVELVLGGVVGGLAVGEWAEGDHVEAVGDEVIPMDSPHEVVRG
jgi:hypothetical protein